MGTLATSTYMTARALSFPLSFLFLSRIFMWSSHYGSAVMNPTSTRGRGLDPWPRSVGTHYSVHEDAGSIPGLPQWLKDSVLPLAMTKIIDAAQIHSGCGCGISRHLQLQSDPSLVTSICHRCILKGKKIKK